MKDGGFHPAVSRDLAAQRLLTGCSPVGAHQHGSEHEAHTGKECPGEAGSGGAARRHVTEVCTPEVANERPGAECFGDAVSGNRTRGGVVVTMLPAVTAAQERAVSTARCRPASERSAVAAQPRPPPFQMEITTPVSNSLKIGLSVFWRTIRCSDRSSTRRIVDIVDIVGQRGP
jgi:hypothetical protein